MPIEETTVTGRVSCSHRAGNEAQHLLPIICSLWSWMVCSLRSKGWGGFFVRQLRFQVRLFLLLRRLSIALTASPGEPANPLVVPSVDSSHGGWLAAPLFCEGR